MSRAIASTRNQRLGTDRLWSFYRAASALSLRAKRHWKNPGYLSLPYPPTTPYRRPVICSRKHADASARRCNAWAPAATSTESTLTVLRKAVLQIKRMAAKKADVFLSLIPSPNRPSFRERCIDQVTTETSLLLDFRDCSRRVRQQTCILRHRVAPTWTFVGGNMEPPAC